jgi:hypothetical protein
MRVLLLSFLFCLLIIPSDIYCQIKFDEDIQSVSISGDNFYVEADVISLGKTRIIKSTDTRAYTWFYGGQIHSTQGGYTGKLLHGEYTSVYTSKTLKESGEYKYGLKHGIWKYWYENGNLKCIQRWKNGLLNGVTLNYNESGELISKDTFKKGRRHGYSCSYQMNREISKQLYKNNVKVIKPDSKAQQDVPVETKKVAPDIKQPVKSVSKQPKPTDSKEKSKK